MSSHTPQGPRSTDHSSGKNDLGFDPDSPDLSDPQVDPTGPAKTPHSPKKDSTAKENAYSPDFKSPPEPKPHQDADIDTPSG